MVITQKIDYRLDTPGLLRERPPSAPQSRPPGSLGKAAADQPVSESVNVESGFSEAPGRVFCGSLGTLCEVLGYPCVLLFHGD